MLVFAQNDLKQLRKNVVIAATTIFAIANSEERMKRQNPIATSDLLKNTTLECDMKLLGVWEQWTRIKAKRASERQSSPKD